MKLTVVAACLTGLLIGALIAGEGFAQKSPEPKAQAPKSEDIEFFEKRVRPLLVENCVSCHSGAQPLGGLRLDPVTDIQKGGTKGAVVVPGDPDKSKMIQAVRHLAGVAAMPPSGKLTAEQIATLTEWVRRGASVPTATAKPISSANAGFPLEQRRQHWSYRPVKRTPVPNVRNAAFRQNPIDAFLQAKREANGIAPAAPTDKRTLIRRVTYDLIGLPPTPAEIDAFLADKSPNAYAKVVDRLLASPHYGERWARHWLDLVRYAESLGHEFDYSIYNAYRYRDYVIRAFNADVPYDQFVREHLAGDLFPKPRRNPETGINESLLATGFFFLGEGKHSPVDVRQEQADRIDNQIDVLGKTFLAQTVACARCHDHKFDPIPTKDYYALYGILKSSRYQQAIIDPPTYFAGPQQAIDEAKKSMDRSPVAKRWRESLQKIDDTQLKALVPTTTATSRPIAPFSEWKASGPAFARTAQIGDLILTREKTPPALISEPTAHSSLQSPRLEGVLRSPTFTINSDFLQLRVAGQGGRISIVVDNFIMIRDPLYGVLNQRVDDPKPTWRTVDLRTWKGHEAYIEVADNQVPNPAYNDSPVVPESASKPDSAWVSLSQAFLSDHNEPITRANALSGLTPTELRQALEATLTRWSVNQCTEADSPALAAWNALLQAGLLDTAPLQPLREKIVALEARLPVPHRAPAMADGNGRDEYVFVRGSHKTPGDAAPRLRLAVCFTEKSAPTPETGSGRLELANWIASPKHPLTARVMVNRIWKHHFGVGIVPTTDDFGHMGEKPSHPELLDWLASEFIQQGWSMKKMHRLIVLSQTYQMSSKASDLHAERKDPKNALLHRMSVRRLEAEAVHDGLLAVSGRLDPTLYGPSIHPYLLGQEGRGFPPTGPLDGEGRRTIYLEVRRNFPSLFLTAFDLPTPFTTIGRRSVSNVPAQALTLMNSDFVWQQSEVWADRMLSTMKDAPANLKIRSLYQTAFARPPLPAERDAILAYLNGRNDKIVWTEVCHALYNAKEFIYVF